MDEVVITDLKQFISATVFQHTSGLSTGLEEVKSDLAEVKADLKTVKSDLEIVKIDLEHVKHRVDEIQVTIEESVFPYITTVDDQVQNHEARITKLEHKPA